MQIMDKEVKLQVFDTAGQERFQQLTANYYKKADGVLLVYDCTDTKSFENVDTWSRTIYDQAPEGVSIFLICNKVDLENQRVVSLTDGEEMAQKHNMIYKEASALNGLGVEQVFEEIAQIITNKKLKD